MTRLQKKIDKLYRINTRFVRIGNVPRDVLVPFKKKIERSNFVADCKIIKTED